MFVSFIEGSTTENFPVTNELFGRNGSSSIFPSTPNGSTLTIFTLSSPDWFDGDDSLSTLPRLFRSSLFLLDVDVRRSSSIVKHRQSESSWINPQFTLSTRQSILVDLSLSWLTFISRRWFANEYLFSRALKEMNDQFTLNTSSVFMLFETLKISSPLGKEIPSVGAARLRFPSFVDSSPDVSAECHRSSSHLEIHPLNINNLSFGCIYKLDRAPLLNSSEHRSMDR